MFKKLCKYLKNINIYGLDFHLFYKKEEKFYTIFDIILSLIFIVIFSLVSLLYFKDILYKTNFSIISNSIQLTGKEETKLDLSNSSLIFALFDYKGEQLDFNELYFSINLYKTEINLVNNKSIRSQFNLSLERCTNKTIPNQFKDLFNLRYNINELICVSQNQNLTIAGQYGDNFNLFDIIEFHVKKCENDTNNNFCKSEEEINLYLSNTYFHIIYLNYFVDHYNSTYPINLLIKTDSFMTSLNNVKRYYYYFSPALYISDNGLIFNSKKEYNFVEYKKTYVEFVESEKFSYFSSKTFIEIAFSVHPYKTIYERRYVKLQDVLSNIGGFTNIICLIFGYISFYFSEKCFIIDISKTFINKNKVDHFNLNNSNIIGISLQKSKSNFISSTRLLKNEKLLNINNTYSKLSKKVFNNNYIKNYQINQKKFLTSFNDRKNFNFPNSDIINISTLFSKMFIKKYNYTIIDYCLPLFILKKMRNKNYIYCYEKIFKKYMSIEVMIPLFERISKNIDKINNNNCYFNLDSFLENKSL